MLARDDQHLDLQANAASIVVEDAQVTEKNGASLSYRMSEAPAMAEVLLQTCWWLVLLPL
jgi:hypothetical protein